MLFRSIYNACLELDLSEDTVSLPLNDWLREQENRLHASSTALLRKTLNAENAPKAEIIRLPTIMKPASPYRLKQTWLYAAMSLLLIIACSAYSLIEEASDKPLVNPLEGAIAPFGLTLPHELPAPAISNELPDELQYKDVDRQSLIAFLNGRNSLLAEAGYYDAIVEAAASFDIHPVFLFAITGQEQSFVPRTDPNALAIANNPFNVFYSWRDYNSSIDDSAAIAARTIVRLSKNRPPEIDAFTWINREYAEDPNWSNGVRAIFDKIMSEIDT